MPRGPKKGKRGKHAAAEDWETDSAASTGTTVASRMDRSAEREAIYEEPDIWLQFEEAMDSKRSATRERALKDMVDCLRSGVHHSEVVHRMATLSNYLERAFHVKRSSASEMRLSAIALALMMVQLAAEEAPRGWDYLEEMFDGRLLAALQQKATDASGEAKAAVLTCIAILAFVSEHHLAESMATLRSHWYAKAEKARVAALEGWALLMTIDTAHMQPEDIELVLSQLAGILGEATTAEERNVSVRVASGRAFALLYGKFDLGGLQEAEDVDMEAQSEASMGGGSSCASQADGGPGSGLGAMKKRIQELVRDRKDHGWRISGAELAHQKSSLREVDLVIEQGGVLLPKPETVKLKHGGSFVVESWEQKLQKEALVALLQGGFQVHCEANRMIVQLFDIDVRTRCADAEERRAAKTIPMSAESKWRDQERKCKRSATRTYKDSFLLCEL